MTLALVAISLLYTSYSSSQIPQTTVSSALLLGQNIPRKIWQIYFPSADPQQSDLQVFGDTTSWLNKNPDYTYTLFGSSGASAWVATQFAHRSDIIATFESLRSPVLKSDFLRYLLLAQEGGTYSDVDTTVVRPIDDWIPEEYQSKTRAIVGIEYDQRDDERWPRLLFPLQFCQWTISVAPGHRLLNGMIDRVLQQFDHLVKVHYTTLSNLKPTDEEVGNTTGPVAWTQAVFADIYTSSPHVKSWKDLSYLTEPTLFGDILILPINGFGAGQPHSGSVRQGEPPGALVRHHFRGSWKLDWNG